MGAACCAPTNFLRERVWRWRMHCPHARELTGGLQGFWEVAAGFKAFLAGKWGYMVASRLLVLLLVVPTCERSSSAIAESP